MKLPPFFALSPAVVFRLGLRSEHPCANTRPRDLDTRAAVCLFLPCVGILSRSHERGVVTPNVPVGQRLVMPGRQ